MSADRKNDLQSFFMGLGCTSMAGVCMVAAVGVLSNEKLRDSVVKALAGVLPGQRPPIVQTATPLETGRIGAATAAITRTSNGTPLPPNTVLAEPTPAATRIIEATRVVSYIQEVLGPRTPVVRDSVWPGGIDRDTKFVKSEAKIIIDIFNGASSLVTTDWMRSKLSAARSFMVGVFRVPSGLTVDGGTLTEAHGGPPVLDLTRTDLRRTSDTFFETKTSASGKVRIYEVFSSSRYSFNQVAAYDKYPGTAYVNNQSVLDNEKLYVIYIFDKNEMLLKVLTFRGACGNIGQEEVPLPAPTMGATPTHLPTPTAPGVMQTPPPGPTETPVRVTPPPQPPTKIPPTQPPSSSPTAIPTNVDKIPTSTPGPAPTAQPRVATPTQIP